MKNPSLKILCSCLILTGILSSGCKEKTNPSSLISLLPIALLGSPTSSAGNEDSVSADVGASGGNVKANDGSFSLEIPAGALSETRRITITRSATPIGDIPEEFTANSPVLKFEPEGLQFAKPAILTVNYQQDDMEENGIEEGTVGFYYIKNDSTVEEASSSFDTTKNILTVEIPHFSFARALTNQIRRVNTGKVTSPKSVLSMANRVIKALRTPPSRTTTSQYFQANISLLGPFLLKLVEILGYDPISAAFPNADFDGDGIPNSEDPFVPSTGPQLSIVSTGGLNLSTNAGAINSSQFVWKSTLSGTFSIRKGATSCTTGTVVSSGSVSGNVNQNFGPINASSDLTVGTNTYRICVVSSGVTGAITQSFNRDDISPNVSVNPASGTYGAIQNIALICGDIGGAGCSKVAYTLNGSNPGFGSACSITNGTLYSNPIPTPDSSVTTLKFKSCDSAGNISTLYSESYTVDSVLPSITINSVSPGVIMKSAISPQINWQSNKAGDYTVKIGSDCNSGTLAIGTNINGTAANATSITTTVQNGSQLPEGNSKINFCVTNLAGNIGSSSVNLTVDSTAPSLSISPNAGVYASQQTIQATCTDAGSGCNKIAYTTDGSDPAFDSSGTIVNGNLYSGALTTPNHAATQYKFIARDAIGNLSSITAITYTIGTLPPTSLSYANPNASYFPNAAITPNNPTVAGSSITYSIIPALPTGIGLNASTGVISGTPTVEQGATNYVVTATNAGGSVTANISITIATPVPVITNLKNKAVVETGFLIGTITGGASVEVSLDSAGFLPAIGTSSWTYKLPTGSNTWKQGSSHTITARPVGSINGVTITVTKGTNKDVNGDGYADLAVGSSTGGYIFHSTSSGISITDATSANTQITGVTSGTRSGMIVLGDLNGDGYADMAIGAPSNSPGKVYLFHSSGNSGITATSISNATSVITNGHTSSPRLENFGSTLAIGDANGDGYADLAVGAPTAAFTTLDAAFVFHSSSSGIASLNSTAANTYIGSGNKMFGYSVAFGDVNADGYVDLAVSAAGGPWGGASLYVFHSSSSGISASDPSTANTSIWGVSSFNFFDSNIALADLNGDGFADLIAGAYSNTGDAYIFHSSASGITATAVAGANTTIMGSNTSATGTMIALGDMNGDGYLDIAMGSPLLNSNAGTAYIFHSSSSGVSATNVSGANSIIAGATSSKFGGSISIGDWNGDGYFDLAVGAPILSSNAGGVYLFQSTSSGVSATSSSNANTSITSTGTNQFGKSVR